MKKKITLLLCLITQIAIFAQTTYTFNGNGDWTDITQWESSSAPGLTINSGDEVIILGTATIAATDELVNNGSIDAYNGISTYPKLTILGEFTNNNTFEMSWGDIINSGTIVNDGNFILNNTDIDNSESLINNSVLTVNSFSRTLTNTGTITNNLDATFNSSQKILNQDVFTNNGTINVSRDFDNENTFENTGSITITNGANFDNTNLGNLYNSGNIAVSNFSQISNNGAFTNESNGTINILGNSTLRLFAGVLTNLGAIANTVGTFDIDTDFTNDGLITNDSAIDISATVTNNNSIVNNSTISNRASFGSGSFLNGINGNLINNGNLDNNFFGTNFSNLGNLEGNNTTHDGDFTNSNILSPGNSTIPIGAYILDEKLILESTSVINIEVESLTSFDNITSAESTDLGASTLNVTLLNTFAPAVGDSFTIMNASSILNTFSTVNLPKLSGNKSFEITYNHASVTLTVISTAATYTFTGNGNWTDANQWHLLSAPGLTINPLDEVIILGEATIEANDILVNNGTITANDTDTSSILPTLTILGEFKNNGKLNYTNGTIISSGMIQNDGELITVNTTIDNSGELINNDLLTLNSDNASNTITNTGTITNDLNATLNTNQPVINENALINNGIINVSKDFDNINSGLFTNRGSIFINNSHMSNYATLTNAINGAINIGTSATLSLSNGAILTNLGIISNINGTFNVDVDFANNGTIINNNILDISGTVTNNNSIINNNTINNSASVINTINGTIINKAVFNNNFNGSVFNNLGNLKGNNTSHTGDFTNDAILTPGNSTNSIGTYNVTEKLILKSTSTLNIELQSVTSFDKIIATESIQLGASELNITLLNNFDPIIGDSFKIMDASSIINTFGTINLPSLLGSKAFEITYNDNNITLTVVLTPTTYTFNGNGNWTDSSQWKLSNAPGLTINPLDEIIITGEATIGANEILVNNGTLTVNNTGTSTPNLTILGAFTNNGDFNSTNSIISNSGNIQNDSNFITSNTTIDNSGDLINNSILTINSSSNSITNNGIINNGTNALFNANQLISNKNIFINHGTINVSKDFNNENTLVNNGNFTTNIDGNFNNTGNIEGINISHNGDFTNSGTLTPGNSTNAIGTYQFTEKLILEPSSFIDIEVESLSSFDIVSSAESIELGTSILTLTLLNSFDPAVGDSFEIMAASSISNTFSSVNLPTLSDGKSFDITYNDANVTLTVVDSTLSTDDIFANTITVYPNPSITDISISGLQTSENIEIFNYLGQSVLETTVSPLNNDVDTSKLATGVYFIKIKNASIKFVKQ